jgi:hypothetical protein
MTAHVWLSGEVLWWVGKSGGGESDSGVIRQKSAAAAAHMVVAIKLSK